MCKAPLHLNLKAVFSLGFRDPEVSPLSCQLGPGPGERVKALPPEFHLQLPAAAALPVFLTGAVRLLAADTPTSCGRGAVRPAVFGCNH